MVFGQWGYNKNTHPRRDTILSNLAENSNPTGLAPPRRAGPHTRAHCTEEELTSGLDRGHV